MWGYQGGIGPRGVGSTLASPSASGESAPVAPAEDVSSAAKLFSELFDAKTDGKSQTVQDVRDKLSALREEMGDEKFKALLNKLIAEASGSYLEFLRKLLNELFPDSTPSPAPSPSPSPSPGRGGGRGGGGGRVNPSDFGPRQPMNDRPFTAGARHADYKPDNSNPGKKPPTEGGAGNIWSGFRQSDTSSCITVSAIKAAMMKFGQKPTDVFKDVKESGNGYDVEMRDGFKLHLSRDELKQAAQQARFEGTDPAMMTDANFMFAASAKRAQMEGNEGGGWGNDHNAQRSFGDALQSLNDGEHGSEGLDRLGLKGLYRRSSSDELASGVLGVANYSGHSMAVIGGRVELWGTRGNRPSREDDAYAFR